jgi:hypothetical protein
MSEYSSNLKLELQSDVEYAFSVVNSGSNFIAFSIPPFYIKLFLTVSAAVETPSATLTVHYPSIDWMELLSSIVFMVTDVS